MRTDKTRYATFSRRALLVAGGQMALLAGLAGRMYYLQVLEAEKYRTLAEDNRINLRLLPPPRGDIVDRFGEPVAINVQTYRAVVVPEQAGDVAATLEALSRLVPLDERDYRRTLKEAERRRAFVPITVRDNLSWEEVSRLEVNAPDLPGVVIDVGLSRYYPHGSAAAHVLGYVGAVNERDLTGDPLLELPNFRIGRSGVERVYDLALRGRAGNSQVEVNAIGRVIRELRRQEGQPGREVALTLDMGLQLFSADRLNDEIAAAVVVMDAHHGDVLAMVSKPSFNTNIFSEGVSTAEWRALSANPLGPLTNKAVVGQYAPGSTFKPAVMLAALEGGIAPDHAVFCRGHTTLGNQRFHCWKRHGHGHVEMIDAMRYSCDIWFYDVALKLGVDRIADAATRLGLGAVTGIDLPVEKPGLIPTRGWKQAVLGQPWHKGESLITAIGQGFVLTTPLQLAVMTARLVNGGYAVQPRLTLDDVGADGVTPRSAPRPPSLGIDEAVQKIILQSMDEVVNHRRGTAYGARIEEPEFAMGGKTGTSQVRRITRSEREAGVRKNEELEWRSRDHALFVGYAPVSAPRYVCAVIVEHGGGGSTAAAPIARDILLEAQKRGSSRAVRRLASTDGEGAT